MCFFSCIVVDDDDDDDNMTWVKKIRAWNNVHFGVKY